MTQPVGLSEFLSGSLPERAAVLADLDGCLIAGDRVLPGVPELIARCGERLWVVSNNSTDTAEHLSARLGLMGLAVAAERMVLAGEETLRNLQRRRPGARVALFAAPPLVALARKLGLVPDRVQPEVVLLARDTGFSFADLTELTAMAAQGLPVLLSNPDTFHPGPDGTPRPETGALWAAARAAVPAATASSLAKPAPDLVHAALSRAGVAPGSAVFLGDTPETDGRAAAAAGVEFVLLARPGGVTLAQEIVTC
ncbi:HAD-IIA family hydrolase [Thioclava nitratireducens]|uniref:HAD-IIA family hydrolase n=1 Tax=Thioclava nitratireducens TaxID=1915078 RepID=UPI0024812355|nr:HAD family hydrolase [Thioclava nitratireducens]WGT51434.1 HAD hydrolase-like protein [Thioclava nitratireducens]